MRGGRCNAQLEVYVAIRQDDVKDRNKNGGRHQCSGCVSLLMRARRPCFPVYVLFAEIVRNKQKRDATRRWKEDNRTAIWLQHQLQHQLTTMLFLSRFAFMARKTTTVFL